MTVTAPKTVLTLSERLMVAAEGNDPADVLTSLDVVRVLVESQVRQADGVSKK